MARALVLAAGGVTGALYEVGVVRAMEERHGSLLDRFDLFVGISAGASVAAFLAQGVSPTRLHEALLDPGDPLFPLRQRHLAAFDLRRAIRIAGGRSPVSIRGRELVDGNVAAVAHLDLLAARGIDQIVVVSPRAPVENTMGPCVIGGEEGHCLSLRHGGPWAVHDQSARIAHQERLHLGILRFELEHPAARVELIEPERADATLFLANPMSLATRREVLEAGLSRGRSVLASPQLALEVALSGRAAVIP